jgi:hypothetical protein
VTDDEKQIERKKRLTARDIAELHNDDRIFDDFDRLIRIAQEAFTRAAQEAVAENDCLGIPTCGARHGRLVFRVPGGGYYYYADEPDKIYADDGC